MEKLFRCESSSSISAKAYCKVTHSGFRDDIVEGERKTVLPNSLLNSMKEYDLPTDWTCTEPSMLKALWDLWASSLRDPNHGWKSTQRQKSLTMELRKHSGGIHSLLPYLWTPVKIRCAGLWRTIFFYLYKSTFVHDLTTVWHFLKHIKHTLLYGNEPMKISSPLNCWPRVDAS